MNKKEFKFIKIKKLSGSIGAVIENVKLNEGLTNEIFDEIYDAFLEYQVIFLEIKNFLLKVKNLLQIKLELQ